MTTSYYTEEELKTLGLKKYGRNVMISRKSSIYKPEEVEMGDNVRIDDFCVLSGKLKLGNFIHIASGCYLFGGSESIEVEDFAGLSSRVVIYAVTDDYSGIWLTNPTVPGKYRKVIERRVLLGRHVIIGTGATILPGVTIGEGAAVGAMSLVTKDVPAWTIVAGIPAKPIKERKRDLLNLEQKLLDELKGDVKK